jgi:energy-coupling factor transport system permease protein
MWRAARTGLAIISVLVTWSLENAIDTADSMRSRGYGLPGRTAFSVYRFDRRDRTALVLALAAAAALAAGTVAGVTSMGFFPALDVAPMSWGTLALYVVYGALLATPVAMGLYEDWAWKRSVSKI